MYCDFGHMRSSISISWGITGHIWTHASDITSRALATVPHRGFRSRWVGSGSGVEKGTDWLAGRQGG